MEKLLFTLVVICLIAIVITASTYYGAKFQRYLSEHHLKFHWDYLISALFSILIVIYIIYSMAGIITAPEYTKSNGNVCKGYKYGIQICSGDINAE